jgi:glycosidase
MTKRIDSFKWLQNARIYQLLIDRFVGYTDNYTTENLKKNFIYGNLSSLMTKLDYIKSLNFNMIWLSPFFVNQPNGYHGYHVINLNHVDPRFAFGQKALDSNIGDVFDPNDVEKETSSDLLLKQFIGECHKKNLFVMMDIVPNHIYKEHPIFIDALKNPNSKYRDWFYFIDNPKNKYVPYLCFLSFGDLPKLNLDNEDCFNHVINSIKKFLSYNIDAIRIDHCIGPKLQTLKRIVDTIHKDYPDVPFIGECMTFGISNEHQSIFGLKKEQLELTHTVNINTIPYLDETFLTYDNIVDGLIDFSFQVLLGLFAEGKITEKECVKEIEKHFERFEESDLILIKNVDSHDTDRILFKCKNNIITFKKVMNLLYRHYNGRNDPLILYYGTEDFMTQEKSIYGEPYGDYRCRKPMEFCMQWMKTFFKEKNE